MLKIVAVSCQGLNADAICQGGKIVFSEKVGEDIDFTKTVRENLLFLLKKVREIFVKKST